MITIKDLKEKTLQIACNLSQAEEIEKHNFDILNVYHAWEKLWREDFKLNGGLLPDRYCKKFVLSKKNPTERQPDYIEHYNTVLTNAFDWIVANYDKSKKPQTNYNIFAQQLIELRKNNFESLKKLIQNKDNNHSFYIADRTNYNDINCFGRYVLYSLDEHEINAILKGTYGHIRDFILNTI